MDPIIAAALTGFIVGVLVGGSRRRPTCHENTNPPQGPPPLKLRRSGYIPRPQGGTPNPPPSDL